MLRAAAAAAAAAAVARPSIRGLELVARFCGVGGGLNDPRRRQNEIAKEMIQYSLGLARSKKSAESYAQAVMVLDQGVSNMQAVGGEGSGDAVGMLSIAMSTLLHERGEIDDAMEKLRVVRQLDLCSLGTKVAAWEGLVGLSLEAGQDDSSLTLADECMQILQNEREKDDPTSNILYLRGKAMRGLVDLVRGDLLSAERNFGECEDCESTEGKYRCGNLALSCGEFLHVAGNFSLAKDFYNRALQISEENSGTELPSLSAVNMIPEEVSLGATCAMGQLLMHSKDFHGAEDLLTKALNKAEKIFGPNHPKVGVVLTCIALMYGQKARMERSSSLLIQEGLYRRAIDYLKPPPLTSEDAVDQDLRRKDIIALARGAYAEILSIQSNRRDEGERLRKLAESQWMNRRLSLSQALAAEPIVVDTRIGRIL
ncbi:tetratricopeptide repeat (TPR)-like superfamily protein [Wolffia australiana]